MLTRPKLLPTTPWGQADTEHVSAPGIVFYSTPSHGGYHLDEERYKDFQRRFPLFRTFAGGPWFEEDCDSAVVVLAFWEHFTPRNVWHAIRMVKSAVGFQESRNQKGWVAVAAWLESDDVQAQCVRKVSAQWETENSQNYEPNSYYGSKDRQETGLRRIGDGHRVIVEGDHYSRGIVTPDELAKMTVVNNP